MDWMIRTCKQFLDTLLGPVDPTYRCIAFRAANWSVSPSKNVVRALVSNGIKADTSVFKYGRRDGIVTFDYSRAYSPTIPWRVKEDDICDRDDASPLWELPIYSEARWIGAFLTPNRIYRAVIGWRHKVRYKGGSDTLEDGTDATTQTWKRSWMTIALQKHSWKADFNQCTGKQLISALHRASSRYDPQKNKLLTFVLIGHSKLFTKLNERSLTPFLVHTAQHPDRFGFDTLSGISCF
jgi:hypothetical protein